MTREDNKNIFHKIGLIFVRLILWLACIASSLFVILLCSVSLKALPEARVFDWTVTAIFAVGSAWLWYLTLRGKNRAAAPESAATDGPSPRRPLARYALVLILSALVFPGTVLTLLFAVKSDWITAFAGFSLLVALPFFGIKVILERKGRLSMIRNSSSSQIYGKVNENRIIFSRSSRLTAFWFAMNGFCLTLCPLWIFLVYFGISAIFSDFSWSAVFLTILGIFIIGVTLWLVKIQYRFFRDRNLPLLVLDEQGIHFRRAKDEVIPWSELTSAKIMYMRGQAILLLGLQFPERYIDRFNRWYSKDLWLGLHILKGPESAVVEAIHTHPLYQGV